MRDLIWLHAADDVDGAIEMLIDEVFAAWAGPARAFWYSSTIFAGLEGLPRTHRAATHRALLDRGFVGEDLWSYQTRPIEPTAACELGFVEKRVLHDDAGTAVAEYEVGIPYPDLGALWWITTYPPYRGRGFAGRALDEALASLAAHGARSVMLFVDDDEPAGERDRRPALALYASRGFREVDRLWSYAKGDLPPDERTTD